MWEELEQARLEWESAPEDTPVYFRVVVLGGKWTAAHKGRAADAISGQASGKDAEKWCRSLKHVGATITSRYDMELYTAERAAILARAWCSKMQHFYSITALLGKSIYQLSGTEMNSWVEPSEFTALAEEAAHAGGTARAKALRGRVAAIRGLFR